MSKRRQAGPLVDLARELGYEVRRTANQHFQCRHPATGALVVVCATSGENRTQHNTRATLRRGAREAR